MRLRQKQTVLGGDSGQEQIIVEIISAEPTGMAAACTSIRRTVLGGDSGQEQFYCLQSIVANDGQPFIFFLVEHSTKNGGSDHDKQRFVKGFIYHKFQEVLSVYFDVTVLHSDTKTELFAYKNFFALPGDRRHLVWDE